MSDFKDHFSQQAEKYAQFRPTYPAELFQYLSSICKYRNRAWDSATGNGQCAVKLSKYFNHVIASDASERQIGLAPISKKISYRVAKSEKTDIKSDSIDLITVAQAVHWFDLNQFYNEVDRVMTKSGIIAIWCYPLFSINKEIDSVINWFYKEVVGSYWPVERQKVEEEYRTLEFPFREIKAPNFQMTKEWDLGKILGYINTWSAVKKFNEVEGTDPVTGLREKLLSLWGDQNFKRKIKWKIFLKVGMNI